MSDLFSLSPLLFGVIAAVFVAAVVFIALVCALNPQFGSNPRNNPAVTAITTSGPHATIIDDSRSWARLVPSGREVFFPKAHANAVYELTLTGVILRGNGRRSDAFHQTDNDGNFSDGVGWLRVNGHPLGYGDHEFVARDRCEHRYVLRVVNAGERLTLALDRRWESPSWHGAIMAEVTLLPAGTLTSKQQWALECKKAKEEKKRDQAKQEAAAEAAHFAQIVKDLTVRSETERNWRDPEFRQKFARVHRKDLVEHQAQIRQEARQFLEQHRVVAYLRRHNPVVVETILGRFLALLIAENLTLDNAIAPAESPKPPQVVERPKPKLNAEQVKALKVRRQQIELGDKVALAMDRIATMENVKTHVREQFAHLGEDEQARIIQNILDQIDEEENQNGKTL